MYKIIHRNDGIIKKFKTEFDLIDYICRYDWRYNLNKYDINRILENYCHNWNDFHWDAAEYHWDDCLNIYPFSPKKKRFLTLMILDHYGRIVNVPDFNKKVNRFVLPPYNYKNIPYEPTEGWKAYERRCPLFLQDKYYRSIKIQNERKSSFDEMHIPYVRHKRRAHFLDPWDIEAGIHRKKTWKQLKIKRQWMEKL